MAAATAAAAAAVAVAVAVAAVAAVGTLLVVVDLVFGWINLCVSHIALYITPCTVVSHMLQSVMQCIEHYAIHIG